MFEKCKNGVPGNAYEAFSLASLELPLNETARRLSGNFNAQTALANTLAAQGLNNFINLTHSSDEARIALAMYAGDGIVAKIIPTNYMGAEGAIYHVPAITAYEVKVENRTIDGIDYDSFMVKTYPWVPPGQVDQKDVEDFRALAGTHGMKITPGDDKPNNIHTLPIQTGRKVTVDSVMFDLSNARISPEMLDGWHKFMRRLYPVYETGMVPRQNAATNFNFVSLHDRKMEGIDFDDETGATIIPQPYERKKDESFVDAIKRTLGISKREKSEEPVAEP